MPCFNGNMALVYFACIEFILSLGYLCTLAVDIHRLCCADLFCNYISLGLWEQLVH